MNQSWDDGALTGIFNRIHSTQFGKRFKRIEAGFHNGRSLSHRVEWNVVRIKARVSRYYRTAPENILEIIAWILLAKVYRKTVPAQLRREYRAFSETLAATPEVQHRARKITYSPLGRHYNLTEIFNELNSRYFQDQIAVTHLGWSKRVSKTRLGFYDPRRDLIVISRVLDHPDVPADVVTFICYHEMLHIAIPGRTGKTRRILHPKEFRQREKEFHAYSFADNWIKSHLHKIYDA